MAKITETTGGRTLAKTPNIQRLNRGNLPAAQRVHMGYPLAPAKAPTASTAPVASGPSPAQQERIRKLEAQVTELKAQLEKANQVLQQLGPLTTPPEKLLQNLKDKTQAFEDLQARLLQQTALAETLDQKVKDLEAEAGVARMILDTPKPPDKVWVTTIQSRTTEDGNVVVACTMHSGEESEAVPGTILIPQSEFGKLRPPKQS